MLEILFEFIYPRKHPTLKDLEFETLAAVAEAAEKYEVFSAMSMCDVRMRYVCLLFLLSFSFCCEVLKVV